MNPLPFNTTNPFSDRGAKAEKEVQKYLTAWAGRDSRREFNRLVDSKAVGRTIKAAAADFDYYCATSGAAQHGLIEVKETQHDYRLAKGRLTQLPRLRKRANCGGLVVVLVYHSTIGRWRYITINTLTGPSDKGSWNLSNLPTFSSPGEALTHFSGAVVFEEAL